MLSNFAERAAMNGSQALFYIFDNRCFLVEGAAGDDESFSSAKFGDNIAQLLACAYSMISTIFHL